ncbi:hypothetical protein [Mesorhizobium marinum]|uniref:hypothetical protein n=1 Tax=Mesorhizobium marinum TaxID=3228790 RepID=UPI003465B4BA
MSRLARTLYFIGLLVAPDAAVAADLPASQPAPTEARFASGWTFSIDPIYGWIPGFKGDVSVFGNDAHIDVTTLDILDNLGPFLRALDGYYMGSGEWRSGRYGLGYDIVHFSVSGTRDFGNRILTGSADLGFSLTMATLTGNYRAFESAKAYADIVAGVRYTKVNIDLDLTVGPIPAAASGGDDWFDPVLGIRGRYDFADHWYVKGQALGGALGGSDYLYDLSGLVGYSWSNGVEAYAGWRAAHTSYDKDDFTWDVTMTGPMLGLSYNF